jgi:predicted dehydrogenase
MNQDLRKKTYRWGILGAGRIAEKFATALLATERAEVYAVASRDGRRAQDFASRYQASRYYNEYEQLVTDPHVDIIYIATPNALHCEQALLCMRNKKAVLCEKPMALNFEQASKMVNAAHVQQVFLMEGMWSRFMPAINKAKELVEAGAIGNLQYIHCDFGFAAPFDPQGRLYNKALGGGSILDVGVYSIFLATFFLGEPVSIQSNSRLTATGVDEYSNMILQYPGGQTAHLFTAINIQTKIAATLIGTKGTIELPTPWYKTTDLTLKLLSGETENFHYPHDSNGFEHEIREVTDCLDRGLMECPAMPLDLTLSISKVMDTLLQQAGVRYTT